MVRKLVDKPPVSEMDGEYLHRRHALLHRTARAVLRLPEPDDSGSFFIAVGLHRADLELFRKDLVDAERELNLLLTGVCRGRVRIRECEEDDTVLRGRVRIALADALAPRSPTRLLDEGTPAPAPRSAARLVQVAQPGPHIVLPAAGGVIGRDAGMCQMVIDSPTVSRQHARIRPRADGFTVEDLNSANGVTINSRTTELGVLQHGDILGLGQAVRLRLELHDST